MEVVHPRCCGIDVHKQTVVACLLCSSANGTPSKEVRTFGTMTADLLQLADWLTSTGGTRVAMESTGVYWKPLSTLLEGTLEVLVVNARHLKTATTEAPQWKHSGLDRHGPGDRSDPRRGPPATAVALA